VNEPFICEGSDIRIEAIMLAEKEHEAVIEWNIYKKNNVGNFELLKNCVLCSAYGKKSEMRLDKKRFNGDAGVDTFAISLVANKI
jgi:hypothetical protein